MAYDTVVPGPERPLAELGRQGQAVWLDYWRRGLLSSGELSRLVAEDGLTGVLFDFAAFEKAIAESTDYVEALGRMARSPEPSGVEAAVETLAIEDLRSAAEVLEPVYRRTGGGDGFVCFALPARWAHDTAGTVAEARRLWAAIGRSNAMLAVPATSEGVPAIEELLAEGINVNAALVFSLAQYEAAAGAYLRGLRRWLERGGDPERLASVVSVPVSPVDRMVDRRLDALATRQAAALQGRAGIAVARQIYGRFHDLFAGSGFRQLERRGARPQRLLWAATASDNARYPDLHYVEALIGPDTVSAMTPATLWAFLDHGAVRGATLLEGQPESAEVRDRLAAAGVDLDAAGGELQEAALDSLARASAALARSLSRRRDASFAPSLPAAELALGPARPALESRLQRWQADEFARRLWRRDPTLWSERPVPEIRDRLGWLAQPEAVPARLAEFESFAEAVRAGGVRHVVLLGMGGSSLAPEVLARTVGKAPGYPELIVLDSTHPDAVLAVERRVDLGRTLVVVSSKSGSTTETQWLFDSFWSRVAHEVGEPGRRFVAITDRGSPLEALALERRFRKVWYGPPDVGGRYSALTPFGLVPAALLGVDLGRLLDRARAMAEASAFCVPPDQNPGLLLGAAMGELARAGRDKLTFLLAPSIAAFGAWVEQLIAESTGKDGRGILPVVDEAPGACDAYGPDRAFVWLDLAGQESADSARLLQELREAGHPTMAWRLSEPYDLGAEFFRWELAVAAAGAVLGVHPFDQPDVQRAKDATRQVLEEFASTGRLAEPQPVAPDDGRALAAFLAGAGPGRYVAIQAYLAPSEETTRALARLQATLRDRLGAAVTVGYGPRFLHSTGQFHKGGPNTGYFLQLTDDPIEDLPLPGRQASFGTLIRAQALGDYRALRDAGRRVLRVHLGADVRGGLARLTESLSR